MLAGGKLSGAVTAPTATTSSTPPAPSTESAAASTESVASAPNANAASTQTATTTEKSWDLFSDLFSPAKDPKSGFVETTAASKEAGGSDTSGTGKMECAENGLCVIRKMPETMEERDKMLEGFDYWEPETECPSHS
eukprot:g4716.t1